ncbi:hypothetical protein, partial [Snodgrassella alvi]|uniref:hypothetical protein n=2 Tax=Snodgrassella alvi TaxID=1196083 RepID=UPI0012FD76D9
NMSDIETINKKCEYNFFVEHTKQETKYFEKNCPFESLESTSDSDIPENIEKEDSVSDKRVYLYQSGKFSLFLEEKPITDPNFDPDNNTPDDALFLEKDGQIVDELTVNRFSTGEFGFTNELSYYIDKKFNIFIINHGIHETGYWLNLWAHYKIDPQKIKFEAIKIKTDSEQINFPDKLIVLPNQYFDKDLVHPCSEEYDCNDQHSYIYYLNEVKKSSALLGQKSKALKNTFTLFKKKLDQTCIKRLRLHDNKDFENLYFNDLYSCEINGLKQELIRIEKELGKY